MAFKFERLEIPDLVLIEVRSFGDHRGFFMEIYRRSPFVEHGMGEDFVQDNYSHSRRGVLRGLHYQKRPAAQAKLVMALKGEIFDVGVDIRRGSPTYGKWAGVVLKAEKPQMLYLPAGFAHGFCVLSAEADFVYKVSAEYAPELDRGILWNDPGIGVEWPIAHPVLSAKDEEHPLLEEADNNFVYAEG